LHHSVEHTHKGARPDESRLQRLLSRRQKFEALFEHRISWPNQTVSPPVAAPYLGGASGIPEQGAETFLLKMPVVGQYVNQTFAPHGLHRNAIRETVALVGTARVRIETAEERFTGLRDHLNTGIAQYFMYVVCGLPAHVGRGRTEER
jgi:hypothetical protein